MKVLSFGWTVRRGQESYVVYDWELETQSEGADSDIPNHMSLCCQLLTTNSSNGFWTLTPFRVREQ